MHTQERFNGTLNFDLVFPEHGLKEKHFYIQKYEATVLAMGDDWRGIFKMYRDLCEVIYLPRTLSASTTETLSLVKKYD